MFIGHVFVLGAEIQNFTSAQINLSEYHPSVTQKFQSNYLQRDEGKSFLSYINHAISNFVKFRKMLIFVSNAGVR